MDHIMPYWRANKYKTYKPDQAKFTYDRKETIVCEEETTETGKEPVKVVKTTVSYRQQKRTLNVYKQSPEEDVEHFFEALEHMQNEMDTEWARISASKTNDASILFKAMEKMLEGIAKTEWQDIVKANEDQHGLKMWEDFKTLLGQYISTKVIHKESAYERQRRYMRERRMPIGMEVSEWWLRIQTLNRYLPYLIPSMQALKYWHPDADWKQWWKAGSLSEPELKEIILERVPRKWALKFEELDVGNKMRDTFAINEIVDYFERLQRLESKVTALTARRGGPIRAPYAGRGNDHMQRMRRPHYSRNNVQSQSSSYNKYPRGNNSGNYNSGGNRGGYLPNRYSGGGYNRNSGRFGGQQRSPQQPGRGGSNWQRQGERQQQQQPYQSKSYYQEEQEAEHDQNFAIGSQEQRTTETPQQNLAEPEPDYGSEEEEALIQSWNENLWLDDVAEAEEMELEEEDNYYAGAQEDYGASGPWYG